MCTGVCVSPNSVVAEGKIVVPIIDGTPECLYVHMSVNVCEWLCIFPIQSIDPISLRLLVKSQSNFPIQLIIKEFY